MKTRVAPMLHRDEVHGDVRFDRVAVALLDTGALQRLGRVHQLGFAPLVYRGGNHTRLSHVMGAYHTAGKLVDALRRNYGAETRWPEGVIEPREFLPCPTAPLEDRWTILRYLVGWAALLHDVAHVPIGHTLEDEFDDLYRKHDDFLSPRALSLWVDRGDGGKPEIREVLSREDYLPEVLRQNGVSGDQAWRVVLLTCLHRFKREGNHFQSFAEILAAQKQALRRPKPETAASEESNTPVTDFQVARARTEDLRRGLRMVGELEESLARTEGMFRPYMADIVADTICADYLDYLQRDPRNLGLDVLRDDRVVSQFWVGAQKGVGVRMALALEDKRGKPRLDTTTGVVDLVRQRYRFAEIVYYHKTKAAASVMFATALHLLGKASFPEVSRYDRLVLAPGAARRTLEDLKHGRLGLTDFRTRATPSSLLDPEIGDDSLMLMMQQRAIEQVWRAAPAARLQKSLRPSEESQMHDGLRALALLQNLARRNLHKVVFAMDAATAIELNRGSSTLASDNLDERIQRLRKDRRRRNAVESDMQAALKSHGLPNAGDDCLLLYIPGRKSQAKGIETGALDNGEVITLGEHRAVKAQVTELGQKYRDLWRLLVFASPDVSDPLALSRAIDELLRDLFPKLRVGSYEGHDALARACWFRYVGPELAAAAVYYRRLPTNCEKHFELTLARSTSGKSLSDEEIAARAALMDALMEMRLSASEARNRIMWNYKHDGTVLKALRNRAGLTDLFKGDNGRGGQDIRQAVSRLGRELVTGRPIRLEPPMTGRRRRQRA